VINLFTCIVPSSTHDHPVSYTLQTTNEHPNPHASRATQFSLLSCVMGSRVVVCGCEVGATSVRGLYPKTVNKTLSSPMMMIQLISYRANLIDGQLKSTETTMDCPLTNGSV
jgi:hypothetical protein